MAPTVTASSPPCPSEAWDETGRSVDWATRTLVSLCQDAIVNRLERYPPEAFRCLTDVNDFEDLIRRKHMKTKPREGSGGLDGTGRVAPAVRPDYIAQVEEACPHLAQSTVVDALVWKDCVEFRFKRGGMTRPRALNLPWPVLVQQVQEAGQALLSLETLESIEHTPAWVHVHTLETTPMSVALLQTTGIGKTVKKILKQHTRETQTCAHQTLARILDAWKTMAARSGVETTTKHVSIGGSSTERGPDDADADDLKLLESCKTWRQLFSVLKQREDERRSNLGKEMRERRRNLASDRPKIVKVRPTVAKHQSILARAEGPSSPALPPSRLSQIRKESMKVALQTRSAGAVKRTSTNPTAPKATASFGAAVAFAASYKKTSSGTNRTKGTHVHLAGGKSMKVPSDVAKKAAMAKKWKTTR